MQKPDQNIKAFMISEEYQDKKNRLINETNNNQLAIDRSLFVKTKEEKEQLKAAKAQYKQSLKK